MGIEQTETNRKKIIELAGKSSVVQCPSCRCVDMHVFMKGKESNEVNIFECHDCGNVMMPLGVGNDTRITIAQQA